MPVTVCNQQCAAYPGKHLPEVVDEVLIEEVMQLANHEDQGEPAKQNGEWPLRVAVSGYPAHQGAADQQYQNLDDLDRGKLAGAVLVGPVQEFLQAQCPGMGNFQAHQDSRQQRYAEEIEDVAKPGHARLYTAHYPYVKSLI